MKASELKSLKTRLSILGNELVKNKKLAGDYQRECDKLRTDITSIELEIKNASVKKIVVSEHAILRYCERVLDIDTKAIEKTILNNSNLQLLSKSGQEKFKIKVGKDFNIIVSNNVVVTVTTKGA